VATPHHACIRNFLRSGSSREFVASEASFGRTAVVTNATAKLGRSIRKFLSEQEDVSQWHHPLKADDSQTAAGT
jgi:hypothetical protein